MSANILQALESLLEATQGMDMPMAAEQVWLEAKRAYDAPPERKIVRIARLGDTTGCVDSEGCAWELRYKVGEGMLWERLPPLPQGEST